MLSLGEDAGHEQGQCTSNVRLQHKQVQQEQRAEQFEFWQDQQQAACPLEAVEAPAVRDGRSWALHLQANEHKTGQAKKWHFHALTDCEAAKRLSGTRMHLPHMYACRAEVTCLRPTATLGTMCTSL